jgi:hypothetical protein
MVKAYRTEMTGEFLKVVLEDVADNIFNPDPYYQQGGDMVRTGGLGYRIEVTQAAGRADFDMTLLKTRRRGHRPRDVVEDPMSSRAGPASTRAPKARRSGMSWKTTSAKQWAPSADPRQGPVEDRIEVMSMAMDNLSFGRRVKTRSDPKAGGHTALIPKWQEVVPSDMS